MKICLYYRSNPKKQWELLASGRLDFLQVKMADFATRKPTGRLALVTVEFAPRSTHDLRSLVILASHANVLCKELLPDAWKPIKVNAKRAWRKVDKRQLALDLG